MSLLDNMISSVTFTLKIKGIEAQEIDANTLMKQRIFNKDDLILFIIAHHNESEIDDIDYILDIITLAEKYMVMQHYGRNSAQHRNYKGHTDITTDYSLTTLGELI